MAYKSSKSSSKGGKSPATKSSTVKVSSISGGSSSVSSSGGSGGGGGVVPDTLSGGTTASSAAPGGRVNINNYPVKHFYVAPTPSLPGDKHARTSVLCPLKVHLGTIGPVAGADGEISSDIDGNPWTYGQGFAEVVGVVPTRITRAHDNFSYSGNELLRKINNVTYEYKPGGHKVISIEYANNTGDTNFENFLHFVTLNVLFSDGSSREVKQYIISNDITNRSPLRTDSQTVTFKGSAGRIGGLAWDGVGMTNARFTLISAGAWFTGNYKAADDPLSPQKHYWWLVDDKADKLGAVFHQQSQEQYSSSRVRQGNMTQSSAAGIWDFDDRYVVAPGSTNFATATGADSFFASAARASVGSTYYPNNRLKYSDSGILVITNPLSQLYPEWQQVNTGGWTNLAESSGQFHPNPSNRFNPVNAHYNGGIGTTIRHDGMRIDVIALGSFSISETDNFGDGTGAGGHRRGIQVALGLRSLFKGHFSPGFVGLSAATEDYGLGNIPACDDYGITSEFFNSGEDNGSYCIPGEDANSRSCGNGNDIFSNLLSGNRRLYFMEKSGEISGTNVMKGAFAASMGMQYESSVQNIGLEQTYVGQAFRANAAFETDYEFGLVLPYFKRTAAQDIGYNTQLGADLLPENTDNSDNYLGNVLIQMQPFYSHVEFPVSSRGIYLHTNGGPDDAIPGSDIAVEFPQAQGTPDYVESTKFSVGNTTLNSFPKLLNLNSYADIAHTSTSNYANLDRNSILHIDQTMDSGGWNGTYQDAGFDRNTLQPWGRVNSPSILEQHYVAGGAIYTDRDGDNTSFKVKVFPKSTLTDPTVTSMDFPEVTFEYRFTPGFSYLFPLLGISSSGSTITSAISGYGFDGTNPGKNTQFKDNLNGLGLSQESSNSLGNTLDIYSFQYTPGKHLWDNALYPINTDTVSDGSEVTGIAIEDLSVPAELISNTDPTITTINLTGSNPQILDRPFIDVDVDDLPMEFYNLTNSDGLQFNTVSNIKITKQLGNIGSNIAGAFSGAPLELDFDFVVFGQTELEVGPPVEEILGCTDASAQNFDEAATTDDGSCIYCDNTLPEGQVDIHDYMAFGVSAGVIDAPPMFTGSYPAITTAEPWFFGNIGNAVNYSNPAFGIAFDSPATSSIYTSFQAQFTVDYASILNNANVFGGTSVDIQNWTTYWLSNVDESSFDLIIYPIEAFDYDNYQWANTDFYTSNTVSTTLPVLGGSTEVITLPNIGTAVQPKFGTVFPDDIGETTLGLEAGSHYLAVLAVNVKSCNTTYYLAYNFWVLYCDCDVLDATNFAGNDHSFPWSGTSAFPAGYSNPAYTFCQSNLLGSRTWKRSKRTSDADGLCVFPDPFAECSEFIDFCITSSTFECELVGDIDTGFENIGSGSIYINVFGVLTGSDIEGQEFALVVDGNVFYFSIDLIDTVTQEVIDTVSVTTLDDYLELTGGILPQNVNGVNIAFENVPQGTYSVVLNQLGALFPMQDPDGGLCAGITPLGGEGTVNVGVGENCDPVVPGCCDETATNYVEGCTPFVNGVPFTAYDDTCEYNDCNNVFESFTIIGATTTNSEAECATQDVDTDGDGVADTTENFLGDTAVGGASFTVAQGDEIPGDQNFNIGIVSMSNGNQSVAVETLLSYYDQNAADITSSTTGDLNQITQNGIVVGAFLPTNVTAVPTGTFSANGMYAGNYLAFVLPQTIDPDYTLLECETQLLEFADSFFTFTLALQTTNITDCNEPCNEEAFPENCDDYAPGCTDVSATNYDAAANYDDGTCDYGGTETCITNPELPECEECEDAGTGQRSNGGVPTGGLRNCDETFGNAEGCPDPLACNYNPEATIQILALCEYCECAPDSELCVENDETDDCEDADGNVDPNCTEPICPDPTNPECDTVTVNPCPTPNDCPPPPVPDCIALGNCDEGGPGTEDPEVVIDEVITEVVSCDPMFNTQEFDTWRFTAMECSATEGSKMLFKLRAGVKDHKEQDIIKLTLINYLFNQGVDLPCLFSCDYENKTQNTRYRNVDCNSNWERSGSQRWTPKSTFIKGDVVRILRNVRGVTKATYFTAKKNVPAQQIRPDQRGVDNEYWVRCKNVKSQKTSNPDGETYLRTLYEFMRKFCENCTIQSANPEAGTGAAENNTKPGNSNSLYSGTGLIGDDDNEIIF